MSCRRHVLKLLTQRKQFKKIIKNGYCIFHVTFILYLFLEGLIFNKFKEGIILSPQTSLQHSAPVCGYDPEQDVSTYPKIRAHTLT